ncbi:hemolysin [Rhodobacterales bacterium HKCCSP123]|nr:hemolysin [Rhodobacterales bacterium HKCCSP123]
MLQRTVMYSPGSGPVSAPSGRPPAAPADNLIFDHFEPPVHGQTDISDLVACFTSGTLIATPEGPRLIEDLRVGDPVLTQDHGFRPLRWIGATTRQVVDGIRPVRIARGALGHGLPRRDLLVSPQHGMVARSRLAAQMTGRAGVLLPAEKLIGLPGVDWARDVERVTYLHLLFDAHEIVFAEDAPTESLLPRPHILGAFGPEAEAELRSLFPELGRVGVLPARSIPDAAAQARLAALHQSRDLPILAG